MKSVLEAAVELTQFIERQGWSFCVIGGLAVIRWGRPRTTADVDVTLLTGFGSEAPFIDVLLAQYAFRRPDAREFALVNRILLLQTSEGVGLDVALAGFPVEERAISRASAYSYAPGISLRTASAEDVIISKAFAGRARDWGDIEGIILCQGDSLDWDLIVTELSPLCELKESPETVNQLLNLRDGLAKQ